MNDEHAPQQPETPPLPRVDLPPINRDPVPDRSRASYLAGTPGIDGAPDGGGDDPAEAAAPVEVAEPVTSPEPATAARIHPVAWVVLGIGGVIAGALVWLIASGMV